LHFTNIIHIDNKLGEQEQKEHTTL